MRRGYGSAGEIEARIEIKTGIVKALNLVGDYFPVGEIDAFLHRFRDVPFTREAFDRVLDEAPIEDYIHRLDREAFTPILFNDPT